MWFHGQGYEDHLTTKYDNILASKRDMWKQIDAYLCTVLWFYIAINLQARCSGMRMSWWWRRKERNDMV